MSEISKLAATIAARVGADPDTSWTAKLLAQGPEKCAEKFGEESVEAIIEAVKGDLATDGHEDVGAGDGAAISEGDGDITFGARQARDDRNGHKAKRERRRQPKEACALPPCHCATP